MIKNDLINEDGQWYGVEIICQTEQEYRQAWEAEYEAQENGEKRDVWNQVHIHMTEEKYCTTAEIQQLLNVSQQRVSQIATKRGWQAKTIGTAKLYRQQDVHAEIERRK